MPTHLVSYDLRTPGKNYSALHDHLRTYPKWARPLESVWLIQGAASAAGLAEAIRQHTDANDRIFVVDVTSKTAAWFNIPADVEKMIHSGI